MPKLPAHRTIAWVLGAILLGFASDRPATAHVQRISIGGSMVLIKTDLGATKQRFKFTAVKQSLVIVNHNPALQGAQVLVHSVGANSGKTGMISLHPLNWRETANGWVYRDPDGYQGGIKRVVFRDGPMGGTLKIIGGGAYWPWALSGPQGEVWVQFKIENEWFCAKFGGENIKNETGFFKAKNAPSVAACPEVCGNGEVEGTETCDDGNLDETDGCASDCTDTTCEGEQFGSTWQALQAKIFDEGGCTSASFCHAGGAPAGGLNLEPANAYANIFMQPSSISTFDRIHPGDQDLSFLYLKVAAATLPTEYMVPGSPMPAGGLPPISTDLLQALKLWIRAGAPETGTVDDTAELLDSCLPPITPNKIPPLDPPAAGIGVQLYAPPWDLPQQSEDEICYATYYDFTGQVPASAQTPCPAHLTNPLTSTCFHYHETEYAQDPQSHHSIIHVYRGANSTSNPGWGTWTCKGGPNDGMACNPTGIGTPAPAGADCGDPRSACASSVVTSVACIGYGPSDYNATTAPRFGGAQEPLSNQVYADGVSNLLPIKGIIVWNHHAFNLTNFDTTMEQYFNLIFADPADQLYQVQGVFDSTEIFVQNVPPFESREYCRTFTFPQNAHAFNFSSHTHRFGKLFRIWGPPQASCSSGPGCQPPATPPIYISTVYNDPVQLEYDPPVVLNSAVAADRTYKFCSRYDNGTPDIDEVKRRSTSPEPPIPLGFGGPCAVSVTECIGGANHGMSCNGSAAACPGGECDACPVTGGVTTEDEMYILLGSYYVP